MYCGLSGGTLWGLQHYGQCLCWSRERSDNRFLVGFASLNQLIFADCKESDILGQLAWIIPVSISGGILLPGLLLLVAATCIRIYKVHYYSYTVVCAI